MIGGYGGTFLRVNLGESIVTEESIDESVCDMLLGGAGFGAKIIWEEVSSTVKPLDPENKIIFAVGPLQATKLPGAAKWSAATKSPLTGIFADAAAGGSWGIMLKQCGYDALIIEEKAKNPVYLWIENSKVEIRDAICLWGKDAIETREILLKKLNEPKISIASIGPAGEKLVAIACIIVDGHSFLGRCGLGAVMGSKNLKAIAVKGNKEVKVAYPEKLYSLTNQWRRKIKESGPAIAMTQHGTPQNVAPNEFLGDIPIKYWKGDIWHEGAEKIGAPRYTKILNAKPQACLYCTLGCHRHIKVDSPVQYGIKGSGPEYETLAMLGACCLVDDLLSIVKANDLCNRYGIDTISTGAFIGFSMECYERGLVTQKDTGGLEIKWGDGQVLVKLVTQIGERKGFGALFANGIVDAAKIIGAEDMAVHVKGLDIPGHDPRAFFSLAVNYATGTRGACHLRGFPTAAPYTDNGAPLLPEMGITERFDRFNMKDSSRIAVIWQDLATLYNSLVLCITVSQAARISLTEVLECLKAVTGWTLDMEQMMKIGERIWTLERAIDNRYGVAAEGDRLPGRMFEPAKVGERAGKIPVPFEPALNKYYKLRGWNKEGKPTREKWTELELDKILKTKL